MATEWFEAEFCEEGFLRTLAFPWMGADGERPLQVAETFGVFIVDGNVRVPLGLPDDALRALLSASRVARDLVRGKPSPVVSPAAVAPATRQHGLSYVYALKLPPTVASPRSDALDWAYVNLNFGRLAPGQSRVFDVNLWALRHLWLDAQFSGYAFLVDAAAPVSGIAATSTTPGRNPDAASWLLGRHYSRSSRFETGTFPTAFATCSAGLRFAC